MSISCLRQEEKTKLLFSISEHGTDKIKRQKLLGISPSPPTKCRRDKKMVFSPEVAGYPSLFQSCALTLKPTAHIFAIIKAFYHRGSKKASDYFTQVPVISTNRLLHLSITNAPFSITSITKAKYAHRVVEPFIERMAIISGRLPTLRINRVFTQ